MPKAVIYKLSDKTADHIYVGSTTNLLQRGQQHKSDCKNEKSPRHKNYLYEVIRGNGGWNEWEVVEFGKNAKNFRYVYLG